MITQQMVNIVLWIGIIFVILPFVFVFFYKAYRYGFIPRIGKRAKNR